MRFRPQADHHKKAVILKRMTAFFVLYRIEKYITLTEENLQTNRKTINLS